MIEAAKLKTVQNRFLFLDWKTKKELEYVNLNTKICVFDWREQWKCRSGVYMGYHHNR